MLSGEFVANASHEMRTPIAALKGSIELLEDGAVDKPESRDRFLRTMHVEVDRLQRLVDELFTLAQLDSGSVVHGHRAGRRVRARGRRRGDHATAGDRRGHRARGRDSRTAVSRAAMDRDRVAQVLLGFVDNALKHTPAGGTVTVFAREDRAAVVLGVRDTGPGIPDERAAARLRPLLPRPGGPRHPQGHRPRSVHRSGTGRGAWQPASRSAPRPGPALRSPSACRASARPARPRRTHNLNAARTCPSGAPAIVTSHACWRARRIGREVDVASKRRGDRRGDARPAASEPSNRARSRIRSGSTAGSSSAWSPRARSA